MSLWVILPFALLLIFSGCHKTSPSVTMSDFPDKIGDQWTYFVQDSLANINDTLTLTILSPSTFQGKPSLLWQFAYSNGITDTLQSVVVGDTINYYKPSLYPALNFAILFPFSTNSTWKDNLYGNYSTTYLGNYAYLSYSFPGVYEINHTLTQAFGFSLMDNIYIQPGIGIVHRRIFEFDTGPAIWQTWTLSNYHLN